MRIEKLKESELYNKKLYGHYEHEIPEVMYLIEGADILTHSDKSKIKKIIQKYFPERYGVDEYADKTLYKDLHHINTSILIKGRIAKINISFIRILTEIHKNIKQEEIYTEHEEVEFYIVRNSGEWHIL